MFSQLLIVVLMFCDSFKKLQYCQNPHLSIKNVNLYDCSVESQPEEGTNLYRNVVFILN